MTNAHAPEAAQEAPPRKLIMMANQIGTFFKSQGPDAAVSGTADHIRRFWDPRMRKAILAYAESGGEGLDPLVRDALTQLKPGAAPAPRG